MNKRITVVLTDYNIHTGIGEVVLDDRGHALFVHTEHAFQTFNWRHVAYYTVSDAVDE